MKHYIQIAAGIIGSGFAFMFGGWSSALTVLLVFMALDYVTGLIVAMAGRSDKTESGGLSSAVGFRGLARKALVLIFVLAGAQLDRLFGSSYIRDAICISYILNELLSIIENAGLLGLPIPPVIRKVLDLLQKKDDENDDQ